MATQIDKTLIEIEHHIGKPDISESELLGKSIKRKRDAKASGKSKPPAKRWSDEEHQRFLEALRVYGKDWTKITEHVGTRTKPACVMHAVDFQKKVALEPDTEGKDVIPVLE